ncbi:Retrovirus-related Pol polyprotein from transposon TNT 1-94 [Quillaja saponaria]|uniref:Retrovirus-related Pol polyprotein from transposon TNT 1-94 n=1 Tax=Quillaja saponaria TaxID=32244 RepID=A0AAD7LKB7_QUISA|nr:Retrovirus-related Pol polyprotein from transposon TNT 1-94 [Quillaja saponaria]
MPKEPQIDTETNMSKNNEQEPITFVLRRSQRQIRAPNRYSPYLNFVLYKDASEPESFKEIIEDESSWKWEQAMKEEMNLLAKNKTWDLVKLLVDKKPLNNKWVYRVKNEADSSKRYKARFMGYVDTNHSHVDLIGRIVAVSWISQLQKVVALSTKKAEYVALTEASKVMIWLQCFIEELGRGQRDNKFRCDSQSAIHLAKNPAFHSKMKHIQLRYHFIRSVLKDG